MRVSNMDKWRPKARQSDDFVVLEDGTITLAKGVMSASLSMSEDESQ